jgi:hypothetical protein
MITMNYKDAVRMFVQDCLIGDVKARVRSRDLFPIYEAYCAQLDFPQTSLVVFARELRTFVHTTRSNGSIKFWCKVRPDLVVTEDVNEAEKSTPVPGETDTRGTEVGQ